MAALKPDAGKASRRGAEIILTDEQLAIDLRARIEVLTQRLAKLHRDHPEKQP